MITEATQLGEAVRLLAEAGLSVESVRYWDGWWHCVLRVEESYLVDRHAMGSGGSGPTLASALEGARIGWARYRDRHLATCGGSE